VCAAACGVLRCGLVTAPVTQTAEQQQQKQKSGVEASGQREFGLQPTDGPSNHLSPDNTKAKQATQNKHVCEY